MELFSLPQDKLFETLVPLPLSTIQSLMNSNSEIYRRIVGDEEFWEAKFKYDYPKLVDSYEKELYDRFDNWKQIYVFQKNTWKYFRSLLDEFMTMDTPIPEEYADPEYIWLQKDVKKMPELIVYGENGVKLIDITKYPYGSEYGNYALDSDGIFENYQDEGELLSNLSRIMEVFNEFPVYEIKLFRQRKLITVVALRKN